MDKDQFEELKITLRETIQGSISPKLELLQLSLNNHIKSDEKWKEDAKIYLDMVQNAKGFSKTVLYLASAVVTVYGSIKLFLMK